MRYYCNHTEYQIPSIPQLGDYRHSKELSCGCSEDKDFVETLSHLECDGIHDCESGSLACFTCKRCGEKVCFHVRDFEAFASLGVFDKFRVEHDGLFEKDGSAYPRLNDSLIGSLLSAVVSERDRLDQYKTGGNDRDRYEACACTQRILKMLPHHFNGNCLLYGAMVLRRGKLHKDVEDTLLKYKNIVTTEYEHIKEFLDKVRNGWLPNEISLWDRNGYSVYRTVMQDGEVVFKRVVKRSKIKAEEARVEEMASKGSFTHAERLEELRGVSDNGYYIIED